MKRWLIPMLLVVAGCGAGFDAAGPLTLDDTASTTSGEAISVDVLVNDRPPVGETLALASVELISGQGVAQVDGGLVQFVPEPDADGVTEIRYEAVTNTGVVAVGTLRVAVATPRIALEFPDGTDFGLVYLGGFGDIRVVATATGGDLGLDFAAPGLEVMAPDCGVVPKDASCQLILRWTPAGIGELATSLRVNDFMTPVTGVADHALAAEPSLVSGSVVEGGTAVIAATIVNRAGFNVGIDFTVPGDPRLRPSGSCRGILERLGSCEYQLSVDATATPAGSEVFDEVSLVYGSAQHAISIPVEVEITPPDLVAPKGIFPESGRGVWAQLLFEGIEVSWTGQGGPGGPAFEAEVCAVRGKDLLCIPVAGTITDPDGAATILVPEKERDEFLEAFRSLASSKSVVRVARTTVILRWRVAATSLAGGSAPSPWMTYVLKAHAVEVVEVALFPQPATEFTPVIHPGASFPELRAHVTYELNVFEPVELRLHPIALIGDEPLAQSQFIATHGLLEADKGTVTVTATRDGCSHRVSSIELVVNRLEKSNGEPVLTDPVYSQTTQYYWFGFSCIG